MTANDYKDLFPILYTTTVLGTGEPARCVIAIDKRRAISFRHGEHKRLTMDEELNLYSTTDPHSDPVKVTVAVICENGDNRTINNSTEFPMYVPRGVALCGIGEDYTVILMDACGRPVIKKGTTQKCRHGFIIGNHHAEDGDPGGAVITNIGLVGMIVDTPLASHFSNPKIVPAPSILLCLPEAENEELDPSNWSNAPGKKCKPMQ